MKVLRRQKSGYVLSLILCSLGIVSLLTMFWILWPQVSSAKNPFSTFMTLLWTKNLNFAPGIEFKLAYLFVLGDVLLIAGVAVYILSVQRLYLPGKVVWYRCPFCHKEWRSSGTKALVHCPHCRQLVHPTMVEKIGSIADSNP
jgi:hypothetical protein